MNRSAWVAAIVGIAMITGGGARSQEQAAQAPPVQEPAAPESVTTAVAGASDWQSVSRNSERMYLADIGTMSKIDDVVTVQVARVSRRKTGTDYSHEMDALSFRCATHQVRIGETTEFGPDGAQKDQYDDGGDWAPVRPDTLDAYVEPMVCEGNRSSQTWPSIKAFVDSGRGGAN